MHMASVQAQSPAIHASVGAPDEPDFEFLAGIPMLASLLKLPADLLRRSVAVIRCPDDRDLFTCGEVADRVFVLLRGQVILTASSYGGGDDEIIDIVNPTNCFGEEALLGGLRLVGARALAGSRAVAVDAAIMPGDNRLILDHLYRRQRWMIEEIAALKSVPPAQRLARLILSMVDLEEGAACVRLPALKKVIARKIGVDPCTLSSRLLPKLKAVGVSILGELVEILDVAELRAFSERKATMRGYRRPE